MTKLEEIIKEGWKEVGGYAYCIIYGKENERVLYDPNTDKIVWEFTYKPKDYNKKEK